MEELQQGDEYAKLCQLYEEIGEKDCFIKEFLWKEDGPITYGAAVGWSKDLKAHLGMGEDAEITAEIIADLPPLLLFAMPGTGSSRQEAVKDAYDKLIAESEKSDDDFELYGAFEEKGYSVRALMPRTNAQPQAWVVEFSKDGEVVRREEIPMTYAPVFGPDVEDVAMLEAEVDRILGEL